MIRRVLMMAMAFPLRMVRRHKAKHALVQLASHRSPKLRAIGEALQESIANTLSGGEQERIALIEQRRSFLRNSKNKLSIIDYGAGKPDSQRTKEQMEKGVRSTALVADLCKASRPPFWATVLFKLIRKLGPLSCVELGSCVGISASYQATALSINGKGKLVTLEGSPEIANIANETLGSLHLHTTAVVTGPFHETLKGVLESLKPVDFFFNDGHHDHDAVMRYYHESLPYLSDEAVIVFDDISWSPGMRRAWSEIEEDRRVAASIDLREIGIAVIGNNPAVKEKFRIPL